MRDTIGPIAAAIGCVAYYVMPTQPVGHRMVTFAAFILLYAIGYTWGRFRREVSTRKSEEP